MKARAAQYAGTALERWRAARMARVALGKYIILLASVLHLLWAGLLCYSPAAGGSTPVHILVAVFGGRYRTAFMLTFVAVLALVYPFTPHRIPNLTMAGLLIPQQILLLMSAGASVYAISQHMYADGVVRSWTFIMADQLPVILIALLYSVVVLEASIE